MCILDLIYVTVFLFVGTVLISELEEIEDGSDDTVSGELEDLEEEDCTEEQTSDDEASTLSDNEDDELAFITEMEELVHELQAAKNNSESTEPTTTKCATESTEVSADQPASRCIVCTSV